MRFDLRAFLVAAVALAPFAHAAGVNPLGLVRGRSTLDQAMHRFGAPEGTNMTPGGAVVLYYEGARLGDAKVHLVALHFGRDFIYQGAKPVGPMVVTVMDVTSH